MRVKNLENGNIIFVWFIWKVIISAKSVEL